MIYSALENKLEALPPAAIEDVATYIDFLLYKYTTSKKQNHIVSKKKGFGCLKDIPCKLSPNFDESL